MTTAARTAGYGVAVLLAALMYLSSPWPRLVGAAVLLTLAWWLLRPRVLLLACAALLMTSYLIGYRPGLVPYGQLIAELHQQRDAARWRLVVLLLGWACLVAAVATLRPRRRGLAVAVPVTVVPALAIVLALGSSLPKRGSAFLVTLFGSVTTMAIVLIVLVLTAALLLHRRRVPLAWLLVGAGLIALMIPLWSTLDAATAPVPLPTDDVPGIETVIAIAPAGTGVNAGPPDRPEAAALLIGTACVVVGAVRVPRSRVAD